MPLTYDAGTYRLDNTKASHADIVAVRDAQAVAWVEELAAITREALGIDVPNAAIDFPLPRVNTFAARFLTKIGTMLTDAFVYASGGFDRVSDAGWRKLAMLLDKQSNFANGFVRDLRDGKLTGEQAVARAKLYAGAGVESFEQGRAEQLDLNLPGMPADGETPCLGQCRCEWSIEEFDDRWEATWIVRDDGRVCGGCQERAESWNPYV